MKMKMLCGLLFGTLALAGQALGVVYTDAATNYPGGSWTNGSNGGTGFGPFTAAALSVTRAGAQPSIPLLRDVQGFARS